MKVTALLCVTFVLCLIPSSIPHRHVFGFPPIFNNSCRRQRCHTVRCKSPQSLNCDFEVGTDRCNCCPYCLKGPGTPCAGRNNIEGNCAKGLVCIDAKLRKIPDVRGPYTPVGECEDRHSGGGIPIPPPTFPGNTCPKNCAAVSSLSCIRPQRCQFGTGVDRCGCCPVCLNGPGTPCAGPNNIKGNCAKGLVCIDANLRPISDFRGPNTPVGECENRQSGGGSPFPPPSLPGNECPKICAADSCIRPEGCQYGTGVDRCGCCPVCLNGPGTPCAGPNNKDGNCGKGLVCVDAQLNKIQKNRGPNTPFGECERRPGGGINFPTNPLPTDNVCPAPDCSAVRCELPQNCEFGFVTDECSCCPRCTKGLEDPCAGPNNVEGNCAENLVCVDARQNTIPLKRGQNTHVGKCVVPYSTGKSPNSHDSNSCSPANCAAVSCPIPSNCRFGIGENICSCCPQCAKGRRESCGGSLNEAGVCGRGLKCADTFGREILANGNKRNRIGTCN